MLAAIADIPQTDLDNFDLDEPNSWNEAKASSYSEQWEIGYKEELQSLKDMGVYKLIHRSQVPIGAKVYKGQPIFRLKRDADGKPIWWKVWYASSSKDLSKYMGKTTQVLPHRLHAWNHGGSYFTLQLQ